MLVGKSGGANRALGGLPQGSMGNGREISGRAARALRAKPARMSS
jgi:hypothetical protein